MKNKWRSAATSPEELSLPDHHKSGLTDAISIDFATIPDYVRDELAATTLESVRSFLQQPGGRESLDARIAAKRRRTAAAN